MAERRMMAVVMAAVAVVVSVGVLGGGPAAAAPAMVVTPSTGLLDRHVVEVEVSGLVPGREYLVTECREGPVWLCEEQPWDPRPARLPDNVSYVTADATGAAATSLQVRRWSDCVDHPCDLRVFALGDDDPVAVAPLQFAAEGTYAWPQADLEATFADPTLESTEVTVTASGLDPRSPTAEDPVAVIGLCRDDGDLELGTDCLAVVDVDDAELEPAHIDVDPEGRGEASFALPRHLDLYGAPGYDCAADGCLLVASQDDGDPVTDAVPVSFSPEWAPWASAEAFIVDALEPVKGGGFSAELADALATREAEATVALLTAAVLSEDTGSANAQRAPVTRLYRTFFGRGPDIGGLDFWVQRLRRGDSLSSVARAFGGTPEFRARYGSADDAAVVDAAYRNTLGRQPDASGRAYWIDRLRQGLPRWGLLLHFSLSPEMRNREGARVALTVITSTLAGRVPTTAELVLVGTGLPLSPGYGPHAVVAALIASGELVAD